MDENEKSRQWLLFLLEAPFYKPCGVHEGKRVNYFCFDCEGSTFCACCKHSTRYKHHSGIRVMKSSREIAVARADIKRLVDTSDIQVYIVNGYRIAYLRQRNKEEHKCRQEKSAKYCGVCGWRLEASSTKEAYIYCSIECKIKGRSCQNDRLMEGLRKGIDATIEEQTSNLNHNNHSMRQPEGGAPKQDSQTLHSYRIKRRKGIPQRSPFF